MKKLSTNKLFFFLAFPSWLFGTYWENLYIQAFGSIVMWGIAYYLSDDFVNDKILRNINSKKHENP